LYGMPKMLGGYYSGESGGRSSDNSSTYIVSFGLENFFYYKL
jgi:hypothetical protein